MAYIRIKRLSVVVVILLCSVVAAAQPGSLQIGIEGGPVASTNTNVGTFGYINNYSYGLAVQYHIRNLFIIKGGLSYERKGYVDNMGFFNVKNFPGFYSGKEIESLDYMVMPIMARATYTRKIYIFGEAGIYIAYLLKANSFGSFVDNSGETENFNINTTSSHNKFDAGACIGLGAGLPLWRRLIIELEGRLNLGLVEIMPENGGKTPSNLSENLTLGIRYLIWE